MATTTKKTTKVKKNVVEVKTLAQLRKDLLAKQNELVENRRGHKLGELTNPRVITTVKKDIARLHTAITAAISADNKEDK
ncbi:MAG: 50S ribosomal protein L29 [Candidatus Saccharibacteria bacterium]|nr:50S ribosomal protein L29 [Candidatus Saccharibacteria bacterium]